MSESAVAEKSLRDFSDDEILKEFEDRDLIDKISDYEITSEVHARGLEDEFDDDMEFPGELILDYAGRLRSAAYAKNWHDCMDLAEQLESEAHKWSR